MQDYFKVVPAVLLLLKKEQKVLLLKRGAVSFAPGCYGLIGGKIDGNETARQAIIREAWEEVGITISENDLSLVHTFHRKGKNEELLVLVFSAQYWSGELINKEPEKHQALEWFSVDYLPKPLISAHKRAIECVEKGLCYSEDGWDEQCSA